MRFAKSKPRSEEAIAIVIVMIAILVLAILAGGFAYSMKVETILAMRANNEAELEWLGRSGVEYARWILATQRTCPAEQYDALTQIWAGGSGGPCSTNSALGEVPHEVHLGPPNAQGQIPSYFTWKITDHESKFNINVANEAILQQALLMMGVDAGDFPPLVGAILDWIDPDDQQHVDGAENDYYHGLQPPYDAKNGPIDDLSELLMVRGITPEMYWGAVSTNHGGMGAVYQSPSAASQRSSRLGAEGMPAYSVGFVDLFTPISSGKININTASAAVLQLIPGVDAQRAEAIVGARSGEDDGSGITGPFRSIDAGYLFNRVPGLGLEVGRQISRFCDVHSTSFDVEIEAHVGNSTRRFIAVLGRSPNPRDVQILTFCWKFDK
jgi:general secretion pathway protein K